MLDSLRQPIETGEVAIARANHRIVYPARFQLIAAMNPCRCGMANEPGYACKRAPNDRCVAQYLGRLSGPLLDRFDLVVDVPSVLAADLMTPPAREGSAEAATRVAAARKIQLARYANLGLDGVVLVTLGHPRASSRRSPKRTHQVWRCCVTQPNGSACRRAAITACLSLLARLPTWTEVAQPVACISPKRSPTAAHQTARSRRHE